jgi:selenide,water dikinase
MESTSTVQLTQFSKGSGCGCKIAPAVLEQILQGSKTFSDPHLLVGYDSRDDAAVYDLGDGNAVISTTDFFTPIVNDPYDFGRVAATNAISDVYAMGGTPIMAVAILGWPVEKIDPLLARQVLEGARAVCAAARIPLAGGHSIDIPEPVFGLAVTGTIRIEHIKKNDTVSAGDLIYLSKPLGTGVLSTAMKRGVLKEGDYEKLISVMCTPNSMGADLGKLEAVHAMTDVTGFGLAGHLLEMLGQKTCSAEIQLSAIPMIEGLEHYTAQFIFPDNTTRNYASSKPQIQGMDGTEFIALCDPQTSGGLLIAVNPAGKQQFEDLVASKGAFATCIGKVTERKEFALYLV